MLIDFVGVALVFDDEILNKTQVAASKFPVQNDDALAACLQPSQRCSADLKWQTVCNVAVATKETTRS